MLTQEELLETEKQGQYNIINQQYKNDLKTFTILGNVFRGEPNGVSYYEHLLKEATANNKQIIYIKPINNSWISYSIDSYLLFLDDMYIMLTNKRLKKETCNAFIDNCSTINEIHNIFF